jgi:hypothetical protein
VASGNTSLDGSLYSGNLESYAQGQALGGAYRPPSAAVNAGAITLAFSNASQGTMIWPGGTVSLERFNIVPERPEPAPQARTSPSQAGGGTRARAAAASSWSGRAGSSSWRVHVRRRRAPIWYLGDEHDAIDEPAELLRELVAVRQWADAHGAYQAAQQVNTTLAP